ncbi:petrobactin biosynthesis protein AsbD [Caldalkalibacillus mannanilyticus]|uniref:petrobactin biosynthesis protein AsbD n=1 Tax=Caldalkalibacillus mannanilyticus TaxID=1418 RepID=UPI00046AEBE7|nr:petrobactin biosynthesis protein AsbD [Caldalkalibacillus mannanilyticus]
MNRAELKGKILQVMNEKLGLQGVTELDELMRLNNDLRIDSIMLVQLIVYIEVELQLEIPEDEVDPRVFQTVGSLLDFLETLQPTSGTSIQ